MIEQDILNLIRNDVWMMEAIRIAESCNLRDWVIGAGFVRNKVWDHLHGFTKDQVETNDIDLVYFDPEGNSEIADELLSEQLQNYTPYKWEVVNQWYAHAWNDLPPYESTEDAIATWPETVTAIGVTMQDGKLKLIAPHGIDDLITCTIRVNSRFKGGIDAVKKRVEKKGWLQKWPKLKLLNK